MFGVYCRRWGIPLMDGGTIRLARLIGHSQALDMILTGRGVGGEEALRIGAEDTNAVNPSGLDQADQLTSVHDIAQVFRVGLTDPNFRTLVSTEKYPFPGPNAALGKPRETFEIVTQDKLALHDYPGIIGGKTGYTTQAGRTFVVAGERRVEAARRAGMKTIPAVYVEGKPAELSLIENLVRQNLTAMEEAEALHAYIIDLAWKAYKDGPRGLK